MKIKCFPPSKIPDIKLFSDFKYQKMELFSTQLKVHV